MKVTMPLYVKILLWFFLNLVVLAVAFGVFLAVQWRMGPDTLLSGRVGERLVAVGDLVGYDLREAGQLGVGEVLEQYKKAYGVNFYLFREDGRPMGNRSMEFPKEVLEVIRVKGNPRPGPPRARGPLLAGAGHAGGTGLRPAVPVFFVRTSNTTAY
ncbi:MAG: hypothetical protein AAF591_08290, partial [Verrucomicrobiota bacterium]